MFQAPPRITLRQPNVARRFILWVLFPLAFSSALCIPTSAQSPTPGQNVNMVSGTQWPGGDPFLQRQNEPSVAVSSRNPQHLLAGANDYRTVDLNFFATGETGDAWLGVFKSFDGGATWQSTLLPGYPLDQTPEGLSSPLKTPMQFQAASDPVVRAGTNGLFFYSGIAFNRNQNSGVVFVSRFIDLNNKENGNATTTTVNTNTDPIRYISTAVLDSGNAGQFLDKPWVAVDTPRGTAVCAITVPEPGAPGGSVTQKIPAGNVYMAWSDFVGNSLVRTKVYFSRSTDCGATWSTPVKLSEAFPLNQGVTIAVDPATGNVNVAWRTVAAASTPDGITVAKSTDGGQTFTQGVPAITLPVFNPGSPSATPSFFDESTLSTTGGGPEMRTTAFPSIAIDGCSQIYLAWSQRDPLSMGDARIMMSTSLDGVNWTAPFRVDNNPVIDDFSHTFTRGNQFMPALTFAGGKLMVLYYDLHLDHTLGSFSPAYPAAYNFNPDGFPVPDAQGRLVLDQQVGVPEPTGSIFGSFVNDAGLTAMRHVLDVRVAQFTPAGTCPAGVPSFATARVSQYRLGTTGLTPGVNAPVQQLEVNPPNLPIFEGGIAPFLGDYVDIAGPTFKPNGNSWTFDTAPEPAPVHIATWTDNRDVQAPASGDWTKYTPIFAGQSVFDPTQTRPPCDATATASRNQNIYSSRITQGLAVSSPQTSKPLSTTLQRAFVLLVQNFAPVEKSFRLMIANQPQLANGSPDPGGFASFIATSNPPPSPLPAPTTQLDVAIGPHNGVTRPLFALSGNPTASITINVQEITAAGGRPVPNGLTGFLVLNADGTVPGLIDPDGAPAGTTIVGVEVYNPNVSSPNVSSPNVSSPNVSSPNVSSPNVSSPNVSSPNVSSQSFTNTPAASGLAVPNVSSPNVSSPNVSSPNVSSPNVSSPNVSSPNVSSTALTTNAPISDSNYLVTNNGNTSASYHVQLVSAQPVTSPLQLLLNKIYANPVAVGCSLGLQQSNVLLADVSNPPIQSAVTFNPTDTATDPTVAKNSSVTNTTFSLAPGEQAFLTLRGPITGDAMKAISQGLLAPVVTSQAANTNTNTVPFSFPGGSFPGGGIFVLQGLPDAITGTPYSGQIQAFGGTPPLTFSITSGILPFTSGINGHLTLNPSTGLISGVPGCSPGVFCIFPTTFPFTVQVTDSAGHAVSQQLSIRQANPLSVINTSLPPAVQNSPYNNFLSSRGGIAPITWSVTGLPTALTPSTSGSITGVATTPGAFNVQVQATDSSFPPEVTAPTVLPLTVFANTGFILFAQQPTQTAAGLAITPAVSVKITDTTGAVLPGVTVTIVIGNNPAGATLSGTTSAVSDATGNALFPNLSINVPGTGYTLIAFATGAGGVASSPFNVFLAPPTALTAALTPLGSVALNWNPSVSTVSGYNVYRGTTSGGPYTQIASVGVTNFTDGTVASGQTYFYVVTSFVNNVESVFSNQASAVIPPAPLFFGQVTGPLGVAAGGGTNPDLVWGSVTQTRDGMTKLSVRFASGTFNPQTTRAVFYLDTDQNPATGNPGIDSTCTVDAGLIGTDYLVTLNSGFGPNVAGISKAASGCSLTPVGSAPVEILTDGMSVTFPTSLLGTPGPLNFKVASDFNVGPGMFSARIDTMPNIGTAPASTFSSPLPVNPPSGMLAWWPADGYPTDIRGAHGMLITNGVSYAPSEVGQSFLFDGLTGFITITDNGDLRPAALTVDFWFLSNINLPDPNHPVVPLLFKLNPGDDAGISSSSPGVSKGYDFFYEFGALAFRLATPAGPITVSRTTAITAGSWHHVAGTYDSTGQKLYLDGSLVVSFPNSGPVQYQPAALQFATVFDTGDFSPSGFVNSPNHTYFLNGQLDEIEIHNRALSAAEIQAIFNAGSAGKAKP